MAVRYDADGGEGNALAKRYSVAGYPAFVVLDANGRAIDEFAGYRTPGEFVNRLRLKTQ